MTGFCISGPLYFVMTAEATGRPLSMSSSGSLNVSFLVLWLTISDFSRTSEMKPWSPPVKAGLAGALAIASATWVGFGFELLKYRYAPERTPAAIPV